MKYVNIVYG